VLSPTNFAAILRVRVPGYDGLQSVPASQAGCRRGSLPLGCSAIAHLSAAGTLDVDHRIMVATRDNRIYIIRGYLPTRLCWRVSRAPREPCGWHAAESLPTLCWSCRQWWSASNGRMGRGVEPPGEKDEGTPKEGGKGQEVAKGKWRKGSGEREVAKGKWRKGSGERHRPNFDRLLFVPGL
jgi:hypothetical protein